MINSKLETWEEAEATCQNLGGNLASISDRFEQFWMNNNIQVAADSWIGLKNLANTASYKWSNKEDFSFSHWDRTFPNVTAGNCVVMRPSGFWVNMPCDSKTIRFVIRLSIDCIILSILINSGQFRSISINFYYRLIEIDDQLIP